MELQKKGRAASQPSRTKSYKLSLVRTSRVGVPDSSAYRGQIKQARIQNAIIAAVVEQPDTYKNLATRLGIPYGQVCIYARLLIVDGIFRRDKYGVVSLAPLEDSQC